MRHSRSTMKLPMLSMLNRGTISLVVAMFFLVVAIFTCNNIRNTNALLARVDVSFANTWKEKTIKITILARSHGKSELK